MWGLAHCCARIARGEVSEDRSVSENRSSLGYLRKLSQSLSYICAENTLLPLRDRRTFVSLTNKFLVFISIGLFPHPGSFPYPGVNFPQLFDHTMLNIAMV